MAKKRRANTGLKKQRKAPRRKKPQELARIPPSREKSDGASSTDWGSVRPRIDPLVGDLPAVTLRDEDEVFQHFERVDPRLAAAWKRDVVVHEGPITLRRILSPASFGGSTHYAYVDRRLLWYLRHDPSDQLGARWDGYLNSADSAPPGTIAVKVGLDIVVKKCTPQLKDGDR